MSIAPGAGYTKANLDAIIAAIATITNVSSSHSAEMADLDKVIGYITNDMDGDTARKIIDQLTRLKQAMTYIQTDLKNLHDYAYKIQQNVENSRNNMP